MKLNSTATSPLLWTDAQAATELGLSKKRIQHLARIRVLPGFKIGRTWKFDPESIKWWIKRAGKPLAQQD
jgi:excisionase family DNA binding protein